MKTAILACAFLGAALPALAQDSNVFVVNDSGTDSVTVLTGGRTPVTLTQALYGFNNPYDIVIVRSRNLAVVSNNGAATLTLFDANPPFAFLQTVPVNAGTALNLRGLAISGDERWIYVAGQIPVGPLNTAALFRLDLDATAAGAALVDSPVSGAAEDVVVIDSSRVGGSAGIGPGRVYYSVAGSDILRIVNVNPAVGPTSVAVNSAIPDVGFPTQLALSPDGSFFFAACQSDGLTQHLIRVVPGAGGEAVTYPQIRAFPPTAKPSHQVLDIAFQPNGHAFVLANQEFGSNHVLIQVDAAGNNLGVPEEPAVIAPVGRIRFDSNPPAVYVGRTDPTGTTFGVFDPLGGPSVDVTQVSGAAGPRAFAFHVPPLPPIVTEVWPSGMVPSASPIEIRGANFVLGATVELINEASGLSVTMPSPAVTFVNPSVLRIVRDNIPIGLYEVHVINPNTQDFRLGNSFLSIEPSTAVPQPVGLAVPSRFEGYELLSLPQYVSAGDLLSAINTQFGGYNPSNIRVFFQNGGGYLELNQAPSNMDLSTRSFWMLSRLGGTLTVSSLMVGQSLADSGADRKVIVLQPGWNMATQPTFNPPPVSGGGMDLIDISCWGDGDLSVQPGPSGSQFTNAVTDGLLSMPVEFVDGAYRFLALGDRMFTGRGYWIRNNTAGPLYLEFLTSVAQPKQRSALARSVVRAASTPDLPPAPPASGLEEDGDTSGCGLPGLELFALLGLLFARGRRR